MIFLFYGVKSSFYADVKIGFSIGTNIALGKLRTKKYITQSKDVIKLSILRVGIVGLGNVAALHLDAYKNLQGIKVVAGNDVREDRVKELAEEYGFKGYTDCEEMLKKEKLDLVCVCVPAVYHRKITEIAAGYKVHVLCEKPMAISLADTEAMIKTCRKAGIKLAYGASYRYLPACIKAKEMIDSGMLGNISLIMEQVIGGLGPENYHDLGPHHYPEGGPGGGGLGLVDHGIHLVDLFRWFTGSEINKVFGRGNYSCGKPETEYLTAIMNNGAIGQIVYHEGTFSSDTPYEGVFSAGASWDPCGFPLPENTWHEHPQSIRVHGDLGALRIYHYANKIYFTGKEKCMEILDIENRPAPGNFAKQMEAFARCIIEDKESEVTGLDGAKALQAVLAAYESFEKQTVVSIQPLQFEE